MKGTRLGKPGRREEEEEEEEKEQKGEKKNRKIWDIFRVIWKYKLWN